MWSSRTFERVGGAGFGLALLAIVGGCSTANCTGNPNTDSANCIVFNSGMYKERVERREAEAREKTEQVAVARARNEQLQTELAGSKAEEADIRARLATQRAELDRLAAQIERASRSGAMTPGESSMQRLQIERLRQQQAALQQSNVQNREMQQKAVALQREIDQLKASLPTI